MTPPSPPPSDKLRLPSTKAIKVVYAIIDRPPKKHWLRIGLAFVNRDGSLNVRIDAVPLTGQLHIRDEPQRSGSIDNHPGPDEPIGS